MTAEYRGENLQVEKDSRHCLDRVTSPKIEKEKDNEVIKNSADVGIATRTGRL